MVAQYEAMVSIRPQRLIAGRANAAAEVLQWAVTEKQIAPHVTLCEKGWPAGPIADPACSNSAGAPGGRPGPGGLQK